MDEFISWILYSVPLVYASIFMLTPQDLDFCNFVVYFEIKKCDAFRFVLFAKICINSALKSTHAHMYINAKMIPVETVPVIRGKGMKESSGGRRIQV
jgi:hypothetical protein